MLTLRCSSQNDPLDCSSSVRIDLKQNLGNSGWEEKLKFSPDCEQLIYCSIQEKFNFHQNAKSESLLTVPRTKIKCASSNPVGCLASPNTGDKKNPIQELWNAQLAKSPHQPSERYGRTWICRTQIKPNWTRKTRTTMQKSIQWLRKGQKTGLVQSAYFPISRGVKVAFG